MSKKYNINGTEISELNYNIYKFLTKGDNDLEMLFQILLEEEKCVGYTISKFKKEIRQNRDVNEIINACIDRDILECKDLLEELFLEPIDINFVAARMTRQGWSLEELLKEHKRNPEKKIHRMLNIPFTAHKNI